MAFVLAEKPAEDTPSDLTNVAENILATAPEPSAHAIDAHNAEQIEIDSSAVLDVDGVAFDDKLHTGSKLKNGKWRTRKGVHLSIVGKPSPKGTSSPAEPAVDASAAQSKANAYAAGAVAAASVFMLGRAVGGDEWKPSAEEIAMQNEAWGAYFLAKGVENLSPGLTLSIAIGAYAAPRFQQPVTKERVSRFTRWCKNKWVVWRLNREMKKRGINGRAKVVNGKIELDNGARSNLRDNEQREDLSSKETGEHLPH